MTRVIGITGAIGSGKSTVGNILDSMGIPVVDTDQIVHELLSKPGPIRRAVIERFGPDMVAEKGDGAVDRVKLAAIVFADSGSRRDLEAIIHPAVILECRRRTREFSERPVVAILVPLLFEAGIAAEFDEVWAVVTAEPILRERLRERGAMSDEEIDSRLAAQLSQAEKATRAQKTIDNSGSLEETYRQVAVLIKALV